MSAEQITYLILAGGALLWPIVKLLVQIVYKRFEQRLPAPMQAILEQYASMVVSSVEQQMAGSIGSTSPDKRAIAVEAIRSLFGAAKLPCPSDAAIGHAIEAAVLTLNRGQQH